jgi:uncharacterized protein (DUF4415 family)
MKKEYDFSKGKRGRIALPAQERVTIGIDRDVMAWFRERVHWTGGGSYQTLINQALRSVKDGSDPTLERKLQRKIIREELRSARSRNPK